MSTSSGLTSIPDIQQLSGLSEGLIVIVDQSGKHTPDTVAQLLRQRARHAPQEKIYLVGDGLTPEDIWSEPQTREAGTLIMRQNFILDLALKMDADIYVVSRLRDEKEFVSCLKLAMYGYLVILGTRAQSYKKFIRDMTDHIGRLADISTLAAFHSMVRGVIEITPDRATDAQSSNGMITKVYLPTDLASMMA
ncbi:MAG: hypothetical protein ABF976_14125 [Acetobacter syzygii]|uniref:hypothetical protein n=1 Tax=Acetobacter syzygii TaxID=146476 RepID=UPI0039EB2F38